MVRAVVSRVVPRQRISKAMAKEAASEAARVQELARNADAPLSVARIPTRAGSDFKSAGAGIRPMGNSRRVFLMNPYLDAEEIEGLAHRIHALSNNEGINSILIASDDQDDAETECLPRFITELHGPRTGGLGIDFDPDVDSTWHVSAGYDPVKAAEISKSEEGGDKLRYLMENIRKLALSVKGEQGNANATRVPVLTMPHGITTDAGFSLCMGGYVLATRQTSFKILNPSRGLSFDPVGFSYILPRLGRAYNQRSAKYPGCGLILALAGYEANSFDMVETGLATHLVSDSSALPFLEYNLASIEPWDQQGLVKKRKRFYNQVHNQDANSRFRNTLVANLVEQISDHSGNPKNSIPYEYEATSYDDPALDTEQVPWDSGFFSSDLVDIAAHFDKIFREESSVQGIVERLKEAGSKTSEDSDELEGIRIANELVQRMERQSPLALKVVYQLMKMGNKDNATMENCMERELNAQLNMLQHSDFLSWADHVRKYSSESEAPAFQDWSHKNISSITADEVDSIISSQ